MAHLGHLATSVAASALDSAGSPTSFAVTVGEPAAGDTGTYPAVYHLNNEARPALVLQRGTVYNFTVTAGADHPFYLSTTADGCDSGSTYAGAAGEVCACPSLTTIHAGTDGAPGVLSFAPDDGTPDVLYYGCLYHCVMGNVVVVVGSSPRTVDCSCDGSRELGESLEPAFLVTHGVVMFTAFGVVFPVGGFLAYIGEYGKHMVLQAIGMTVALVGAIMAILFTLGGSRSVNNTHGVVGIALLTMTLAIQPVAVRLGWYSTHRRNGVSICLMGLGNCFLGLLRANAAFHLQLAYSAWVFVVLGAFVFYRPPPKWQRQNGATAGADGGAVIAAPAALAVVAPSSATVSTSSAAAAAAAVVHAKTAHDAVVSDMTDGAGSSSAAAAAARGGGAAAAVSQVALDLAEAIVCTNKLGEVVSMSGGAEELFGYAEAELAGQTVEVLMEERYRVPHRMGIRAAAKQSVKDGEIRRYNKIYSVSAVHKDGRTLPVQIRISSFLMHGAVHFTALFTHARPSDAAAALGRAPLLAATGGAVAAAHKADSTVAASPTATKAGGAGANEFKLDAPDDSDAATAAAVRDHILRRHVLQQESASLVDPVTRRVTRAGLLGVMQANLKRNRLEFPAADEELLVDCIIRKADSSGRGDGTVSLEELGELLKRFGLSLHESGVVDRAAEDKEEEDGADGDGTGGETDGEDDDARKRGACGAWMHRSGHVVREEMPRLLLGAVYVTANIAIFLWRFGQFAGWFGGPVPANDAVPWARGAGMVLNLNCALILLPMCRQFLTALRTTSLVHILPIDDMRDLHMLIGWVIAGATLVHGVAHYVNYARTNALHNAVENEAGLTGNVLALILSAMVATAIPSVRAAKWFHVFIFTHHLYLAFFVVLLIHGFGWVNPNFWKFLLVPGCLFLFERIKRLNDTRDARNLRVLWAKRRPGRVVELVCEKPSGFYYVAGNYAFVIVPSISRIEAHPFTLTSAPDEPYLSFHIRAVGDWTKQLFDTADKVASQYILVDGPYGSAAEEVFDSTTAVMVGAGIGVTPFASVLKNVRARLDKRSGCMTEDCGCKCGCCRFKLRRAYFVWTTRDQKSVEWFGDLLRDLRTGDMLDIRTFLTGRKMERHDLSAALLRAALDIVRENTGRDLVTGHNAGTQFARPDWPQIFRQLRAAHPGEVVRFFFCGPDVLASQLRKLCRDFSLDGDTRFTFSKEVF